jgi:hypothetical protein
VGKWTATVSSGVTLSEAIGVQGLERKIIPRATPFNINPLNAELNPICHLLVLLGAHPIFHINRIKVKKRTHFHLTMYFRLRYKAATVYAMKVHRGSRGTVPLILNLGIELDMRGQLHAPTALLHGKNTNIH